MCWFGFITLLLADAFVFNDVLVVEFPQDVNLTPQVAALLLPALWFQGLYRHQLSCPISTRVITTQLHLSEMPL